MSRSGEISLGLFGLLFDPQQGMWGPNEKFVVWGRTASGDDVTLLRCIVRRSELARGGCSSEISAIEAIVGGHWRSDGELMLKQLRCSLDYLLLWVGSSCIQARFDDGSKRVTIEATPRAHMPVFVHGGMKVGIKQSVVVTPKSGSVSVRDDCELVVEARERASLPEMMEYVGAIAELLALATGAPVDSSTIVGMAAVEGERDTRCEIIRRTFREGKPKDVRSHDLLFTLKDVQASPGCILERYFERRRLFGTVTGLYFGTLYDRGMYQEQQLLSLAHAAEAYHREFVGGKYMSDADFETVRAALVAAIPPCIPRDFRDSLAKKFEYLHEFSLRKRLRDLCRITAPALGDLVGDLKRFPDDVADIRNSLVHQSPERNEAPLPAKELLVMCERLGLLLELCLLREIGFGDELLKRVVENSPRIQPIRLNT